VLERAVSARARVAVLPCCHHLAGPVDPGSAGNSAAGALSAWVDRALAIDIDRAVRLQRQGYRIWTQAIPADITQKNRLLLAAPSSPQRPARSPSSLW